MSDPTIAVIGATGTLGRQVLNALQLHEVEPDQVRLFSSERSEGEELDYEDETLPTEKPGPDAFRGVQAVILAVPPAVARPLAIAAQQQGVWVVDASGAFRGEEAVPLVAPGVNDGVLDRPFNGRIISLAHPTTQALLSILQPLRARFGLAFADVTLLCGSAMRGSAGQEQLSQQTAALMNGREPELAVFAHRLGFNILPAVGTFDGAWCEGERTLLIETARIWSGDALPALTATTLTVPTYHGLTLVLSAQLKTSVDADGVRAVFKEEEGLKLIDDPAQQLYPMPMLTTDDASTHVGRVRAQGPRVQLVAATDNVFRMAEGAVTLALELADRR